METETAPDGGLDPEKLKTLSPLSLLFPEVTAEEAQILDSETARIMERRVRVMDLYRAGKSMPRIRETIGCSLGTVHNDIHTVLEGYKRVAARSAQEHIADCLQRLNAREVDIHAEWEKSKGERIETHAENRNGSSTAKLKKKQAYGDPRLAVLLLQCWDRRCKLLGVLSGTDLAGRDGMPPVKMVAGLDPVEAV
jgi:hypothetical protein